MSRSRVVAVAGAVVLAATMSVVPAQVAGAQSPTSTIVFPDNGATVSGVFQVLDAVASPGASEVRYELTGGALTGSVVATGTSTIFGWLARWDTTGVANGTYGLRSVASYPGGVSVTSPAVTVTVDNPPPTTTVVVPVSGATVGGITDKGVLKPVILDAFASPGVTSVSFDTTVLGTTQAFSATPTIFGWVAFLSHGGGQPCSGCVPFTFPISIQSVASYAGGVTGTSQPVQATIVLYLPPSII